MLPAAVATLARSTKAALTTVRFFSLLVAPALPVNVMLPVPAVRLSVVSLAVSSIVLLKIILLSVPAVMAVVVAPAARLTGPLKLIAPLLVM